MAQQRALPQSKETLLQSYNKRLKDDVKSIMDNFTEIIKTAKVRAGESLMKLVSDLKQFLILNDFPSVNEAIDQRNQQLRALQEECDRKLIALRDEVSIDLYELEEEYYSSRKNLYLTLTKDKGITASEARAGKGLEGVDQTWCWAFESSNFKHPSSGISAPPCDALLGSGRCSRWKMKWSPPPKARQLSTATSSAPARGPGSRTHWTNGLFAAPLEPASSRFCLRDPGQAPCVRVRSGLHVAKVLGGPQS
ncbi:mediator of RNA polymerase II transcription subunit 22 isoform X2 [Lutra lutra]|uniref:mediator of RNA polymerase II transcription subunit 22 isoform X2 n=1 Tax=Lutra lutra TaxID=9657 RepID=UPI001FD0E067|nr:mediator of RNA polymerase II transcription subunit 22 isoform X2 [Lutra lutra]